MDRYPVVYCDGPRDERTAAKSRHGHEPGYAGLPEFPQSFRGTPPAHRRIDLFPAHCGGCCFSCQTDQEDSWIQHLNSPASDKLKVTIRKNWRMTHDEST